MSKRLIVCATDDRPFFQPDAGLGDHFRFTHQSASAMATSAGLAIHPVQGVAAEGGYAAVLCDLIGQERTASLWGAGGLPLDAAVLSNQTMMRGAKTQGLPPAFRGNYVVATSMVASKASASRSTLPARS